MHFFDSVDTGQFFDRVFLQFQGDVVASHS